MSAKARPIHKFASAAAKCSAEGAVYGQCILADYRNVHKDMCLKEFMKLKDCFLAASKNK
ncbi:hypothetical protein K490DRAFT_61393 [Saccharata proteae CBS 121410]|uniref:IMS import disulfide relay-system CHCH-CHCH-like Cx9C domain-containing protein n=1 Tax=Saccharata proteae CBS 121410 TaxID=1314787 RepID=A0A9P4M267_9PEZI|nr:hypothetical protein K490DRAFT_61393 [Saccharata proteae CBS 121410]